MRIALDIDDILCDLVPTGIKLYNAEMGKHIALDDITSFHLHECLDPQDADMILNIFEGQAIYNYLNPIPDAQWGLETLMKQGHRVFLATATPYRSFANKVDWVCKHFPCITSDDIIRIQDKSLLNTDIMVDDKLDNLTKNLCNRVVLDYPWNRNKTKEYVYDLHRAYNWVDIIDIINNIERKEQELYEQESNILFE